MSTILPDLHPTTSKVRAVVTTKWGNTGYRPLVIPKIESYYVDTALDSDADTWTCDIGDPKGDFIEMLARDNEVRIQLFGVGRAGTSYLVTGIADEISYDESGTVSLTGRDLSSLATDSTVPPKQYRHQKAGVLVANQAREIGFKQTNLDNQGQVRKILYTDGSESYWEFWYRLYRREKKWLWVEPNGILTAGILNYDSKPTYYLGTPRVNDSDYVKNLYIPVEQCEFRKSTQQRFGEVWVYGHRGDNGFLSVSVDPTMRNWIKKPRKIMLDTESHTVTGAKKMGWEEIFEGKVGSREITITIPDPGFQIRQNRIARIRIPHMNIYGDWFVVGVRAQGGTSGLLQEIRLREKQYAVSRRVPADPKTSSGSSKPSDPGAGNVGDVLSGETGIPSAWGPYFAKAAKEWCGPWDYNLFLATLIGIADQETGGSFQNERENGGPGGDHIEWYPWEASRGATSQSAAFLDSHGRTKSQWEEIFANDPGPYVSRLYGVGPMQLTDDGVKHWADDHFQIGNRDQFSGGRWHPEHNIWAGARYLRSCLQGTVKDSGRDMDMWMGVMAYNRGVAGAISYFAANGKISTYALSVKNKVYNDPGYLAEVKSARDAAAAEVASAPTDVTSPKPGKVNDPGAINGLTWLKRSDSSVDLAHVDWRLLNALNGLGAEIGSTIVITSGFRTYNEQAALYDRYRRSGFQQRYIAAKPGTSNHEKGEACDCTVGGVAMANAVPGFQLAAHGLHCPVAGDPVHTTLSEVSG